MFKVGDSVKLTAKGVEEFEKCCLEYEDAIKFNNKYEGDFIIHKIEYDEGGNSSKKYKYYLQPNIVKVLKIGEEENFDYDFIGGNLIAYEKEIEPYYKNNVKFRKKSV